MTTSYVPGTVRPTRIFVRVTYEERDSSPILQLGELRLREVKARQSWSWSSGLPPALTIRALLLGLGICRRAGGGI